jgi:(p)ppGpp synthase/HD superfamily hydrolase
MWWADVGYDAGGDGVINIVTKALIFATKAHGDQVRKYTGEPYIVHPIEVMMIVKSVSHTDEMLCAALLHDTIEDTDVEWRDIANAFGEPIANLVHWLSDASRPSDGNRDARKAIDRAHIAKAPKEAQTIKCADLISNSRSILERDHDFAKVYLKEKLATLEVLTLADRELYYTALSQCSP